MENSLRNKFPEIAKEWDYNKNGDKNPDNVSYGSAEKYWWVCNLGHSYEASVNHRTNAKVKTNCPYCSNKKVLKGFNDFKSKFPEIAEEWDYDKNDINPDEISYGANKKVWWKHKVNKDGKEFIHSWECRVDHRTTDGSNCPYCSNQKILKGYNDLLSINPKLCEEWDYNKNKIKPDEISTGSNKKVWWAHKVNKDGREFVHSWEAEVYRRNDGVGCPYCANLKIQKGFNDLKTLNPELAKDWDYDLNGDLKPTKISANYTKKIHWKHKAEKNGKVFEHKWEAVPYSRNFNNRGCPVCAGKQVLEGYNDLASFSKRLSKEWDMELNELKPTEVTVHSNKKVHWICPKNHKYEARINDRTNGDNCPTCSKRLRTSLPEKTIYYYIKKAFPDAISGYKDDWLGKKELDIYIPSLKLAVEYDGQKYHQDKEKDLLKNKLCKDNGIRLVRIREPKAVPLNIKDTYTLSTTKYPEIKEAIEWIIDLIKYKYREYPTERINIDLVGDYDEIQKLLDSN